MFITNFIILKLHDLQFKLLPIFNFHSLQRNCPIYIFIYASINLFISPIILTCRCLLYSHPCSYAIVGHSH